MKLELRSSAEKVPDSLTAHLNLAYGRFTTGQSIDMPAFYSHIDRIGRVENALGGYNPIIEAFNISRRDDLSDLDYRQRIGVEMRIETLESPFRDFEVIDGYGGMLDPHTNKLPQKKPVRLARSVLNGQGLVRTQAREKSIAIFYDHLAGIVDPGVDSPAQGFNNPDAGYWQLMIADYLHANARNLIYKYIQDSNRFSPGPSRFDKNFEEIEEYRKRERDKWAVIAVGDLIAAEGWERFLTHGTMPIAYVGKIEQAIDRYRRNVQVIEKQKDFNAQGVRETLNPFIAL